MFTSFGSLTWITPFGLVSLLAMFASWWISRLRAIDSKLDPSHIDLALPLAFLLGIAGAGMLSLLVPMDVHMTGEMMQTDLRIRLFGILVSASAVVYAYSRAAKLSFRQLLDVFAVPAVLWLLIHRLGCFLAGCCWGDISVFDSELAAQAHTHLGMQVQTLPWLAGDWIVTGVQYPPGSMPFEQQVLMGLIAADASASLPVHPVQLYEAAALAVLFLFMRRVPLDRYPLGTIAVTVASAYAVLRFLVEFLRADGNIVLGMLTMTQLQSIALIAISYPTLLLYRRKYGDASALRTLRSE